MSRRLTTIGAAVICALALSAISASSASAGTTGFECVSGGTEGASKFSDADCTTASPSGSFGHRKWSSPTKTWKFRSLVNFDWLAKLFSLNVEIEATGVECENCTVENKEAGGVMKVTGKKVKVKFFGVKVKGLESKCTVEGPTAGVITTENLKFETGESTGLTLEPEIAGGNFAVFNISGASCSVAGTNIKVTGKARATLIGAVASFNVTKASEELKVEGEKAGLTGAATVEAGEGTTFHPTALTPTSP